MLPRLHLVTDSAVLCAPGFTRTAREVLAGHSDAVALHLRGHTLDCAVLFERAADLVPAADAGGALLLANDRVDLALAAGLAGVVLGRRSIPVAAARRLLGAAARIGYSAHAADEAARAAAEGADFVLFGSVYASASHPGREPAGLTRLRETVAAAGIPVLAIGGVTPARAAEVLETGAHGVAVLGGVWHADAAVTAVRRYREALEERPG